MIDINLRRWPLFSLILVLSACVAQPPSSPPAELPPLPPPVPMADYWYSPQYGWFDRSHIGFGNPVSVLAQVRQAAEQGGGPVHIESAVSGRDTSIGFRISYEVGPLTPEQIEPVMIGILQDATREFEWWQMSLAKPEPPLPEDIRSYGTWFANEDLPSNQLGFISAILMARYNEAYHEENDFSQFYRRLLASFEAVPRPNGETEKPWSYEVAEPARNFEFNFWVPTDEGGYQRVAWPAMYQLPVAERGSGLWQRGPAHMWDKNSDAAPLNWPYQAGDTAAAIFYDPRTHQERFGVVAFCEEQAQYCVNQ